MSSPEIIAELKVAVPALDISRVRATISEPPSFPLNIKSLLETGDSKTAPVVPLLILKNSVPASLYLKSAPSASRIISPPISSVRSPASEIVEPLIVISSTVRVESVPTLVMFG